MAFYIDIAGVRAGQQLVIRCEDNGEGTAAIVFRDRNAAQSPRRFRPAA